MAYSYKYAYVYKAQWDEVGSWRLEVSAMTGWATTDPKHTITADVPGGKKKGLTRVVAQLRQQAEQALTAKLAEAAQAVS
jgi:hypothetical protein